MSRSIWALAETRRRGDVPRVVGERRRFNGQLRLDRRLLPGAVSATKYTVVLLAAALLAMTADPARALAASEKKSQTITSPSLDVVVLAPGSGYSAPTAAALVRAMQRRLEHAGYSPGVIDGRYGPLTEQAVERFQAARGLRVDGIAGPLTLGALRAPTLYPGAGYEAAGSAAVRALQRRLRHDGYSLGPVDGRYGPLTERAVTRFQAAHGLQADGIAGPRTFAELQRVASHQPHAGRSRSGSRRPSASRRRSPASRRPTVPSHPQTPSQRATPARPRTQSPPATPAHPVRTAHPSASGGGPWPTLLVVAGLLAVAAAASGAWLIDRRRRRLVGRALRPVETGAAPVRADETASPAYATGLGRTLEERGDEAAAEIAFRYADERGDPAAVCNLGVLLERRGDVDGAEEAYRRADALGNADGAFNLAGLLLERGEVGEAMAAYGRADRRGDAAAAANLALLLLEQDDMAGARDAYRRADERGDGSAATNLGVLLEQQGDVAEAEAAYRRADERGDATGAFNLGALLAERGDTTAAVAAFRRADERGDPAAAANLGALLEQAGDLGGAADAYGRAIERGETTAAFKLGVVLERQDDYRGALWAYERAQQCEQPEIVRMAEARARAMALNGAEEDQR